AKKHHAKAQRRKEKASRRVAETRKKFQKQAVKIRLFLRASSPLRDAKKTKSPRSFAIPHSAFRTPHFLRAFAPLRDAFSSNFQNQPHVEKQKRRGEKQ